MEHSLKPDSIQILSKFERYPATKVGGEADCRIADSATIGGAVKIARGIEGGDRRTGSVITTRKRIKHRLFPSAIALGCQHEHFAPVVGAAASSASVEIAQRVENKSIGSDPVASGKAMNDGFGPSASTVRCQLENYATAKETVAVSPI